MSARENTNIFPSVPTTRVSLFAEHEEMVPSNAFSRTTDLVIMFHNFNRRGLVPGVSPEETITSNGDLNTGWTIFIPPSPLSKTIRSATISPHV
mmetsp:Transcript_113221/g.222007  ORF Transcript_113221/g.222007 Transcript_113221/m.222007 type:complete len:94 (-) Transcript_113221:269-550(-)